MPDPLELPGMLSAVVPLMGTWVAVVAKVVADCLPGVAAVVGPLHRLPEPAARLGGVEAVRIGGRTLQVINLPTREVRAADVPVLAFAVGCQDEGTFTRADQNSNPAQP